MNMKVEFSGKSTRPGKDFNSCVQQWTASSQSTIMSRCGYDCAPRRRMNLQNLKLLVPAVLVVLLTARLSAAESVDASVAVNTKIDEPKLITFKPELQASKGSVILAGKRLDYDAYAGTLVVHLKGYDDVPQNINTEDKIGPAEASMFYVAYFKSGPPSPQRPITFLFNGGPGSPTVW